MGALGFSQGKPLLMSSCGGVGGGGGQQWSRGCPVRVKYSGTYSVGLRTATVAVKAWQELGTSWQIRAMGSLD